MARLWRMRCSVSGQRRDALAGCHGGFGGWFRGEGGSGAGRQEWGDFPEWLVVWIAVRAGFLSGCRRVGGWFFYRMRDASYGSGGRGTKRGGKGRGCGYRRRGGRLEDLWESVGAAADCLERERIAGHPGGRESFERSEKCRPDCERGQHFRAAPGPFGRAGQFREGQDCGGGRGCGGRECRGERRFEDDVGGGCARACRWREGNRCRHEYRRRREGNQRSAGRERGGMRGGWARALRAGLGCESEERAAFHGGGRQAGEAAGCRGAARKGWFARGGNGSGSCECGFCSGGHCGRDSSGDCPNSSPQGGGQCRGRHPGGGQGRDSERRGLGFTARCNRVHGKGGGCAPGGGTGRCGNGQYGGSQSNRRKGSGGIGFCPIGRAS